MIKSRLARYIVLTGTLMVWFGASVSFAQIKLGYTNPEVILAQMPEFRTIQDSLRSQATRSQAEVDIKAQEFQTKLEDYQEKAALLAEATRNAKEQELLTLDTAVRELQATKERELMQTEARLLQPLLDKVQTAINETARELDLDFVLVNEVSSGPVLLYVKESKWDITEAVMKRLNILPQDSPEN